MARRSVAQPSLDRQFQIQNAADTLVRAEEIKQDRKLMKGVRREVGKRQKALRKLRKA